MAGPTNKSARRLSPDSPDREKRLGLSVNNTESQVPSHALEMSLHRPRGRGPPGVWEIPVK